MPDIRQLTLSHKLPSQLQHKMKIKENAGWKRNGEVYVNNGAYCADMSIETYSTIYTSITGVLFPTSDKEQKSAVEALQGDHLERIQFWPSAVKNLTHLLESTGSKLKTHSMWRYSFYGQKDKLIELFLLNGFSEHHLHQDFFVGFKGKDAVKAYDIEFSISENSSENIILDTKPINIKNHFKFYLVDSNYGLQSKDVCEIKKLISYR